MQIAETNCYSKPPWIFKGSALYQLHLVKAETARAFIPTEFKLVEAFGYTLGGFFLANYEESPAGAFDELVVIAGIVWNPPTSCAWAARVLVSSNDACDHGRKEVGLPSHVAKFSKRIEGIPRQKASKFNSFLNRIGLTASSTFKLNNHMDVQVTENNALNLCNINFPTADKWMGPAIKMSLPSFSGRTMHNPNLLKYSCRIECRVTTMEPAKVTGPHPATNHDTESAESSTGKLLNNEQSQSLSVLLSKPILALKFSGLKMEVEAPIPISICNKSSCRNSIGVS